MVVWKAAITASGPPETGGPGRPPGATTSGPGDTAPAAGRHVFAPTIGAFALTAGAARAGPGPKRCGSGAFAGRARFPLTSQADGEGTGSHPSIRSPTRLTRRDARDAVNGRRSSA